MINIVTFQKKYFLFMKNLRHNQKKFLLGSVIQKLKAAAFQNTMKFYHDQRFEEDIFM